MRHRLACTTLFLSAAALLAPASARADVSFGTEARYMALGGAGLAIIDDPTQAATVNPAALSLRPLRFDLQWPSVGLRARGTGVGDAIGRLATGNLSASDAVEFARDFAKEPSRVEADLGFGVAVSVLDLRVRSQASVTVTPAPAFTTWALSGQDIGTWVRSQVPDTISEVPSGAALKSAIAGLGADSTIAGAAVLAPSLGVGMRLPNGVLGRYDVGDLRVGVRVKPTQIYYSQWAAGVDTSGIGDANFADQAELNTALASVASVSTRKVATQDSMGIGADVGMLWQPAQVPYTTFALTVDNLLEPGFTLPNLAGTPHGGRKLMPRSFNAGAAIQMPGAILIAGDVTDINAAIGGPYFRAGVELRPPVPGLRWLAVRGGYNSGTGFAGGLGIGGFNVAYASRSQVVVSQGFNF